MPRPMLAGELSVSTGQASEAERVYLELVRAYQTAILNYIYRLVGDIDVAEDLTQDTYVKAYRALPSLALEDEAQSLRRAWLYRIAHNVATDHLRHQARLRWLRLEAVRHRAMDDPSGQVGEREAVTRALGGLPDEQREVLVLFSYADLSAAEVAEALGITADAARKRHQRARDAFAEAYQRLVGTEDTRANEV
jgi:RNA polymerase sigma-70 factor, ECF subfamily